MSRLEVHLEITNWKGMSLGAQHYYGQLKAWIDDTESKFVEVQHPMTSDEAKALGEAHDWKYYKAGSLTSCFKTQEGVIEAAKQIWRKEYPGAKILVLGHWVYYEEKPVIDADDLALIGTKILV